MPVELFEEDIGRIPIISATGKLTREDYKSFVPKVEELILKFGKIMILIEMCDFHGWDVGALWEDINFDFRHFSDIEALAIAGDKKWGKGIFNRHT